MSKKTKMADYLKRARRGMKGMVLSWFDESQLIDLAKVSGADVWHYNPTNRLIVQDMWSRCNDWILNSEFTWLVQMNIIFNDTKRGKKIDWCELHYSCTLRGAKSETLNDAMQAALNESVAGNNALAEGHKNKGIYKRCEFTATIIGV